MQLTYDQLARIMPHTPPKKRAAALPIINKTAFDYDITTEWRMAAWLATLAVESGELKYQEELADGSAYEGRKDLGNTQKGDGRKFKGHGRIQITGRSNHQAYTNYLKKSGHLPFIDFVEHPEKLAQEPYATDSAGWFWAIKIKANPLADAGEFLKTQVKVNGRNKKTGLPNHYDVRLRYYKKALKELPDNFQLTFNNNVDSLEPVSERPLLKLGNDNYAVVALQDMLGITATGKFNTTTEIAVKNFQREHNLTVDGIVGPETWAALLKDSAAGLSNPSDSEHDPRSTTTLDKLPAPDSAFNSSAADNSDGIPPETDPAQASGNEQIVIEKPNRVKLWDYLKGKFAAITGGNIGWAIFTDKIQQIQALALSPQLVSTLITLAIGGSLVAVGVWIFTWWREEKAKDKQTDRMVEANSTSTNNVHFACKEDLPDWQKWGAIVVRR